MRLSPAKGQYFAYRIIVGEMFYPDSIFGMMRPRPTALSITHEKLQEACDWLRSKFGGEAYDQKESKLLEQSWCYGTTKIMDTNTHYFGFIHEDDAVLFLLRFNFT